MVVNKGFSFNNLVGTYQTKEIPSRYSKYDTETIIISTSQGTLKPLYSQNSYDEGSIAYEFAAINTNDINEILSFCSKYGLLYTNTLTTVATNNYIFLNQPKNDSLEIIPSPDKEQLYLRTFVREVISMRRLLTLKTALDTDNNVLMLTTLIQILLTYTDKTEVPGNSETEHFNSSFYRYIKNFYVVHELCSWEITEIFEYVIKDYLDILKNFLLSYNTEPEFVDVGAKKLYKDMLNSTWQNYFDILSKLLSVTSLYTDEDISTIHFSEIITTELIHSANITEQSLKVAAITCISDYFNSEISLITPEIRYENKTLTADWNITTLLEAMYMELLVTITPNTQIKKCANPTCNMFFDVGRGNSRKIYCSQRCGLLMAKRKQRQRAKQNQNPIS